MGTPTERLLATRAVLERGRSVTAEHLAAEVGVSTRTARRHVRALRDLGVPIESARGPTGGYRLARGPGGDERSATGAVLHLEDDEAVAVAVALSMLGGPQHDDAAATRAADGAGSTAAVPSRDGRSGDRWGGPSRRAAARLEAALGPGARERVAAVRRQLAVTTAMVRDAPDAHVTLALATALDTGTRVRLRYADARGRVTDRDVDPHGLVLHGGRWYLAAWDTLREDRRTFRLDRVVAVLASSLPIDPAHAPDDSTDAAAQVLEGVVVAPWTHVVEVTLHAPRATVESRLGSARVVLTDHGTATRLRVGEEDLAGCARWLASLPWSFDVVSPVQLRDEVRSLAARLTMAAGEPDDGDGVETMDVDVTH